LSRKDVWIEWLNQYGYHTGTVYSLAIAGEKVYFGGDGDGNVGAMPCSWEEGDVDMHHLDEIKGRCISVSTNGGLYYGGWIYKNANGGPYACYWSQGGTAAVLPAGGRVMAMGSRDSNLFFVVQDIPGKSFPAYWDGTEWHDMVGTTDIGKAQIRCYAVAE
jgi:hypothetical protein